MSSPLYALLLVPCLALSGIKTNFERIGLRRIKFGGTFQIRKSFRGVRAGRAGERALRRVRGPDRLDLRRGADPPRPPRAL